MVLLNITDAEYQAIFQKPDIITQVFTAPWVWICIAMVLVLLIVMRWKGNSKSDISTKQFYGVDIRREVLNKGMKKRLSDIGTTCKVHIRKGTAKLGLANRIEHDKELMYKEQFNNKLKTKEFVPDYYYNIDRIRYRNYGLIAWLKALFGYGYKYIVLTPDSYTNYKEDKKDFFLIDPLIHLINDSDVWTVGSKDTYMSNKELILKIDQENQHGAALDTIRKMSVYSSAVAASMEKASHDARLEEEKRKSRIQPYM
jgi:hypothetical protein